MHLWRTLCCCPWLFSKYVDKFLLSSFKIFLGYCPSGQSWIGKPYGLNSAHSLSECSSKGLCNRDTVRQFEHSQKVSNILFSFREVVSVFPVLRGLHAKGVSLSFLPQHLPNYWCNVVSCNCNGHGICLPIESHYQTFFPSLVTNYNLWDKDHVTACVCDIGNVFLLRACVLLFINFLGYTGPGCTMSKF